MEHQSPDFCENLHILCHRPLYCRSCTSCDSLLELLRDQPWFYGDLPAGHQRAVPSLLHFFCEYDLHKDNNSRHMHEHLLGIHTPSKRRLHVVSNSNLDLRDLTRNLRKYRRLYYLHFVWVGWLRHLDFSYKNVYNWIEEFMCRRSCRWSSHLPSAN